MKVLASSSRAAYHCLYIKVSFDMCSAVARNSQSQALPILRCAILAAHTFFGAMSYSACPTATSNTYVLPRLQESEQTKHTAESTYLGPESTASC